MGSLSKFQGSFQSEEIAVVQEAFDSVWATIIADRPWEADNKELKTLVSEKLCAFATSGVRDAEVLRALTLVCTQSARPKRRARSLSPRPS
jgi:hypothetical protein